jgi:hypothetical protein
VLVIADEQRGGQQLAYEFRVLASLDEVPVETEKRSFHG